MASAFAHALAAITLGKCFPGGNYGTWKLMLLGVACSVIPDADVIMFAFGVPYGHVLGHRGFSHSIVFALLLGIAITIFFFRSTNLTSSEKLKLITYFFLCTISHSLLDAMTNGGLGVAVFAPFENSRYFLPWRPIAVSPIGAGNFFTEKGIRVIKSELLWVGVPCLFLLVFVWLKRKVRKLKEDR